MKKGEKGSVAALLIGKMGKEKTGEDDGMDDAESSTAALDDASSRMMAAGKADDSSAFTAALQDFLDIREGLAPMGAEDDE